MCMYNLGSSYYATSLDLILITNTMYEKIRTLTKSINYKVLILLSKISFHNGSSIQCSENNLNSNHIKTNIFRIIKANYTPSLPIRYRWRTHKNIFRNHGDKS